MKDSEKNIFLRIFIFMFFFILGSFICLFHQLLYFPLLQYKIQYQMNKSGKKIIDSVSASQLLKALTTLQKMGDEGDAQISFSDDNKLRHDKNNSRVMNFDQYMAKKVDGKQKLQRKSISPIRTENNVQTVKISELKSRSCSPLSKKVEKSQKTERITQVAQKKTKPNVQQSYTNHGRNARQNKENKPQAAKQDKLYRASFQSKRILDEKQKKGAAYVPIQLRTEELLREKQAKLARLQQQQQRNNILRQKECTFKPNIIKSYKKPKRDDPEKAEKVPLAEVLVNIKEQSVRFDEEQAENQFLCTPTQPVQSDEPSEYLFPVQAAAQPVRKYKNEKFNMLLDLIH